jgi:hypothetical protein
VASLLRGATQVFALPLVRVFINSGPGFNASGLESMPITLAEGAAAFVKLRGGHHHRDNPFEIQARRKAPLIR